MTILKNLPSEGGHWYRQDGTPAYDIIGANGNRRPVTLRDARKLKLVPGFSTIARMEHKPALERWKINQAILSALTLPHIPGEHESAFKERVELDMEAQGKLAREKGTAIHASIEAAMHGLPVHEDLAPFVRPVLDWLERTYPTTTWEPEKSFAHPQHGYGGKTDLYAKGVALIDFKTKAFSAPKEAKGYAEHEMQLHAYSQGLQDTQVALINLFISTTVPGLLVPVVWPWRLAAWEGFQCLLKLWQIRKGYTP